MRPTPEGVGNALLGDGAAYRLLASMRPTPEGVGNRPTGTGAGTATRGFNEAHARRRGKLVDRVPALTPSMLLQ